MEKELPKGWKKCTFGDVAKIQNGFAFPSKDFRRDKGVPLIKQSQLDGDKVSLEKCVYLPDSYLQTKKEFILKKGDVLIGMSGSIGKLCIYDLDFPSLQNQRTGKVVVKDNSGIDSKLLWYFLNTIEFELKEKGKGLGVTNVSATDIESLEFVLPTPNEQKKIVAKLDALMERVNANKERLDKIPQTLKRFRQSVLAAAVSGRLTEEWRMENKVKKAWKLSSVFEINPEYKVLGDLPSEWEWVALGNYVKCERGRFSIRPRNDPKYFNGNIPFIQIGDIPKEGGFINAHVQTLNEHGLKVSKMFPANTVVIAIVGATIGNTGILSYDMCFTDSMVGMNKGDIILNYYLDFYLRIEKENFRQISYAGGGQPNIKLELINSYPFPLPPLKEQQEIVKRVNELFAFADKIEERYDKVKEQLNKLPQSILAKAFRGELVNADEMENEVEELSMAAEKMVGYKKGRK